MAADVCFLGMLAGKSMAKPGTVTHRWAPRNKKFGLDGPTLSYNELLSRGNSG